MEIIEQIKQLFAQLDNEQQIKLIKGLSKNPVEELEQSIENPSKCPHCDSENFIKHSKYKSVQRFKCKSCNRTFLPTTGTLVHNIKKKDKFSEYSDFLKNEGLKSIAYMSEKIGISIPTAFDWRHRILSSIPKKKEKFEGQTQMDDLWFLYSQKGRKGLKYSRKRGGSKRQGDNDFQVKIIAASDKKQVEMKVARIGRISKNDIIQTVGDKFQKNEQIVTDGHRSYNSFAKAQNLKHISFIAKEHKAKTGENIQYINNLAGRFRNFVNRNMRGVSTKFLQLYSSYFAYIQNNKFDIKDCLSNTKIWDIYTNIEKMYEKFIKNKSVRTYRCPTRKTRKSQNWNFEIINLYSYI